MFLSIRSLSLLALTAAGSLVFTGCGSDEQDVAYRGRPAYYGGGGYVDEGPDAVDFYYVGGRPYSRAYGPLVYRDGGYGYSRGGDFVIYDRGSARSSYRGGNRSREVVSNDYRVRNYQVNNYNATSTRYRGTNVNPAATTRTQYRPQTARTMGAGAPHAQAVVKRDPVVKKAANGQEVQVQVGR